MNGKLITTAEGILVFRDPNAPKIQNHSGQLLEDLLQHYNIPRANEEHDLTQELAFYCACYLALFTELKKTPIRYWIDENLSRFYAENALYPLPQTLEKFAALQETKGSK
ncbi:hypothetical protein [uncultured Aggregatibacter sp.]|uniref:hypothetical protein n=1 Tax=uncultured Aggregatibacter sp. TaxID=470564 RepID=UPI002599CD7F|nr:hypothetical protein [uncultured Aggregatibacter sp.]